MIQARWEWKPEYELGVEDIDLQHRYFLDLINRLSEDLATSDEPEYQDMLISELNAYARFHFISEENIMFKAGYPGLEPHKMHHRQLLDQLSSKGMLLLLRRSEGKAADIIRFLMDWFLHHTNGEDRIFARYLQEHPTTRS